MPNGHETATEFLDALVGTVTKRLLDPVGCGRTAVPSRDAWGSPRQSGAVGDEDRVSGLSKRVREYRKAHAVDDPTLPRLAPRAETARHCALYDVERLVRRERSRIDWADDNLNAGAHFGPLRARRDAVTSVLSVPLARPFAPPRPGRRCFLLISP